MIAAVVLRFLECFVEGVGVSHQDSAGRQTIAAAQMLMMVTYTPRVNRLVDKVIPTGGQIVPGFQARASVQLPGNPLSN